MRCPWENGGGSLKILRIALVGAVVGCSPSPFDGDLRDTKQRSTRQTIAGSVYKRDSNGKGKLVRGGSGQRRTKIHQYFGLTNSNRFYFCFGGGGRKSYSDSDR